ncbi:MAG TPA: DMT family transporter, partial [Longimicrobiales bacterium]|nr:DMT family transporter [Longimicrobiales bacterium]
MTGSPPGHLDGGRLRDVDTVTDGLLLLLTLIWGVNFAVIKVALSELHPFAFNALRFPLASLVLYVLLRRRGAIVLPRPGDRLRIVGLGILGNIVYQPLFIVGLDLTTAGSASLLLATTPVWTLLLSVGVRHEEPSPRVWIGVGGTVTGMILVVGGGGGLHLAGTGLTGDLLMMGAAMAWSL